MIVLHKLVLIDILILLDEVNPIKKNLRKRYKCTKCYDDIYSIAISLHEECFHSS